MSNILESTIARRKFLKGAVGAVGTAVFGLSPLAALAKFAPSKVVTVALWDGSHFTPADHLSTGDHTLTNVRMTLRGYNSVGGSIKSIAAYYVVPTKESPIHAPFTAWVAPPVGIPVTRYTQTVDPALGLLLKLELTDSTGTTSSTVSMITGATSGNKLKEGTYVLLDGPVDMNQFTLDLSNTTAPLSRLLGQGPVPQYLVITVERA